MLTETCGRTGAPVLGVPTQPAEYTTLNKITNQRNTRRKAILQESRDSYASMMGGALLVNN